MTYEEEQQKSVYKDKKTQQELNRPLEATWEFADEDKAFLNFVISLIEEKKIDLYKPSTLLNYHIYDKLPEETQGRYDIEAVNMLSAIRDIKNLHDNGLAHTAQMENLVNRLRLNKERIESKWGDVFII